MSRLLSLVCGGLLLGACTSDKTVSNEANDGGQIVVEAPDARVLDDGLCTSCSACEEVVEIKEASHVEGELDYADPPPAGGDHNGCWAEFGVHEEAVLDDYWVHNLEHGGVVYLYDCPDGCDAEVKQIEALATGREFALITPYPGLSARFAAISWGHRLVSDCFDKAVFEEFYEKRANRAPESETSGPPSGCPTR